MAIYIKNWKMPECCGACSLCYSHCAITGSKVGDDTVSEKRLDDCPLYDVPPHGRLGDLDALETKAIERARRGVCVNVLDKVITVYDIETAPTIIGAEET